MNNFDSIQDVYKYMYGDTDISGITRSVGELYALIDELRTQLDDKAYLLDTYISMLL